MVNNDINKDRNIGGGSQSVPEQDQGKKTEREDLDKAKETRRDSI